MTKKKLCIVNEDGSRQWFEQSSYRYLQSPNHGWLVVPLTEAHAFEFKEGTEFSRFSYQDENYAYLEEDLDMHRFLRERGERGVDYLIREVQIKSLAPFYPGLKRWETGKYIWSKQTQYTT